MHKRRLTAIVFTDIEGYTAMMQSSEGDTLQRVGRYKESLKKHTDKFQGKIIHSYGDGDLILFNSAVDAVHCAVALQKDAVELIDVPLRIGIHVGDVVTTDHDVFGDGVNIAARIESFAIPRSVLVSERVQMELTSHPGIDCRQLGKFQLKNVQEPLTLFAISAPHLVVPEGWELAGKGNLLQKSIAVMPFVNINADVDNAFFCEGLAEDLIISFNRFDDLRVASRSSSFALNDAGLSVKEIGKNLSVQTIMEGSVRKSGERIRVTVQAVDASNGFQLWSQKFDRKLEDVFAIQDEIVEHITTELQVVLSEGHELPKVATTNIAAYEYYLKGRNHLHERIEREYYLAIEMFNRAIEADPDYALAHSGLSKCYANLYLDHDSRRKNCEQALAHGQQAIAIDPLLSEGYTAYGYALSLDDRYTEAEPQFTKAIELDAKLFDAHYFFGRVLFPQGKYEDALSEFEKASRIDPDYYQIYLLMGTCYDGMGESERAIDVFRHCIERVKKYLVYHPDDIRALAVYSSALAQTRDDPEQALALTKRVESLAPQESLILYILACGMIRGSETAYAMDLLEKSVAHGLAHKSWLKYDLDWDSVRDTERFKQLMHGL